MAMYGKGRIIPGIIIFLGLMTFPVWYNAGNARNLPKPEKPIGYRECVEPTQYMRTTHMKVLDHWRDDILREGGARAGTTASGQPYVRSLQNGCMKCHADKKKFCDECHNYTAVKPYCWDCHTHPGAPILKEAM
jgi:hypothetical protein